MKKIPSIWKRDPDTHDVIAGEWTHGITPEDLRKAMATVKFDGTATMLDIHGEWWARHAVKNGKEPPPGWQWAGSSEGQKRQGWIPMADSQYNEIFNTVTPERCKPYIARGFSYELVGPRIGKNPHGLKKHELWRHASEKLGFNFTPGLVEAYMRDHPVEGIVWWLHGEPYAKLKSTDIGLNWPADSPTAEVPA